jgi:hypothetical protein
VETATVNDGVPRLAFPDIIPEKTRPGKAGDASRRKKSPAVLRRFSRRAPGFVKPRNRRGGTDKRFDGPAAAAV